MGFNSEFKGLNKNVVFVANKIVKCPCPVQIHRNCYIVSYFQ